MPFRTLADLLQYRAAETPEQVGYIVLREGEMSEDRITYGELDRTARALAARLSRAGPLERVALLLPPGRPFLTGLFAALYTGAVAVPLPPRRRERITRTLLDVEPSVVLVSRASAQRGVDTGAAVIAVDDDEAAEAPPRGIPPVANPGAPALLQYTSGSTRRPRGVQLTHTNVLTNLAAIREAFGHTPESRGVMWLPPWHDLGLVGGLLQPLFVGFPVVLMAPADFARRPRRWLEAITRYRATTSGGPSSAYEACVGAAAGGVADLDLSSWQIAFVGAEPVRARSLARFADAFAPAGFRRTAFLPCYGLAEASLLVTAAERGAGHTETPFGVSCGVAGDGTSVAIVDPLSGCRVRDGAEGEIWVAGPGVADGYRNRPDDTDATFGLAVRGEPTRGWLRTGDLGRLVGTQLVVTGRRADLIISHGQNHHAADIEATVAESCPGLVADRIAAVPIEANGAERLVIAAEVKGHRARPEYDEIVATLRRALAETHDLAVFAVVLVRAGSLPCTTSGKLRRGACRDAYRDGTLAVVWSEAGGAPASSVPPTLRLVRDVVAAALGREASDLDVSRPLVSEGLDSLAALGLQSRLEARFRITVRLAELLGGITLGDIAERLRTTPPVRADRPAPIAPRPLTAGQRAVWFGHVLSEDRGAYNLAWAARIAASVDERLLRAVVRRLMDHHPELRARFHLEAGELRKEIAPARPLDATITPVGDHDDLQARMAEAAHAPFDLAEDALLRVRVFLGEAVAPVILVVAHHIVCDYRSMTILARDLESLLTAAAQGVEPTRVRLLRARSDASGGGRPSGELSELESFWRERLRDLPSDLRLAADRPRRPRRSGAGITACAALDAAATAAVHAAAARLGVTFHTMLLAAFAGLLRRHGAGPDLVIGMLMDSRPGGVAELPVGYFVTPLPVRLTLAGDLAFADLARLAGRSALDAMDHRDLPWQRLIELSGPRCGPVHEPLFQAALAVYPGSVPRERIGWQRVPVPSRTALFDLLLGAEPAGDAVALTLQADADLFEVASAQRLLDRFCRLLSAASAAPERSVADLPLASPDTLEALGTRWRAQLARAPVAPPAIPEAVGRQAQRTPDRIAVAMDGAEVSYQALDRAATRLARVLIARGVTPGARVGVALRRTPRLLVTILAVMRAGAVYVPLDPGYPATRVRAIVDDAALTLVVCDSPAAAAARDAERLALEDLWAELGAHPPAPVLASISPKGLAYVLYTSGSTGRPKGVAIRHGSAAARLAWAGRAYEGGGLHQVLAATSIGFDLSIFELLAPLAHGGTVVLAPGILDLPTLRQAPRVSLINTVPSAMAALQRALPDSVTTVYLAGEPLPPVLAESVHARGSVARLMNLYGPSEDTTYSTGAAIPRGASQIPIGWPLPGTAALVADDALTPLPVGIPGELLLGGVGVADGYLNDPRRTAERFLPDPFAATPGARLYATGDLAIDGEAEGLRWAGRRDGQVKVRGYRIELAEIENALRGDPAVHDAAVVVRGAGTPTADLVAFVTPPAAATDAAALRARLGRTLPDWMVPYPIRGLDALPLTANGKRDRTALLEVAERLAAGPALGEGPRDDLEQRLSAIWRPLLRVDHLGRDESVFARGAHSLTVAEFVARAEETLGLVVSLRSVFDAPTVAQLAAHLREQPARAIDHAADLERLLAEIEGLSEEEASRRLARLDPEPGGSP